MGLGLALVVACGGSSTPVESGEPGAPDADAEFGKRAEAFYRAHLAFRPHDAIKLGHHDYDGRVPDRSRKSIEAEIGRLKQARQWLEGLQPQALSPVHQLDREVLLAEVRKELFDLERLRVPFRQPIYYFLFDFSLSSAVAGFQSASFRIEYAPMTQAGDAGDPPASELQFRNHKRPFVDTSFLACHASGLDSYGAPMATLTPRRLLEHATDPRTSTAGINDPIRDLDADGDLLVSTYTHAGSLWCSISTDDGRSWTHRVITT